MSDLKFTIKFCVFLLFTLITYKPAIAQSEERKIEVGAQFTVLDAGANFLRPISTAVGGGGRVTVDLSKHIALEGELNYFPSNGNDARIFQGQFGLKGGWRFERFGVFGKVRPGFINTKYDFGRDCILGPCFGVFFIPSETRASFDVGGVLEFYPFKQITVRFDAGDTIVNRSFGVHNLQVSTGIGYRF
jgi:Outer membrane protein beta-barrel domain